MFGKQVEFPAEFFENVDMLRPFLNDFNTVYLSPDRISTSQHDGDGTEVETQIEGITEMQAYHHKQLVTLGLIAKTIDWTAYPRPLMFRGDRLRGALVGQRI